MRFHPGISGCVDLGWVAHAHRRESAPRWHHQIALNCWKWTEEKTDMFWLHIKAYERQKLVEGIEWDSDKIVLLEHVRKNLGEKWTDDFDGHETSTLEMSVEEMTKDEYQKFSENLKMEKDLLRVRYRSC